MNETIFQSWEQAWVELLQRFHYNVFVLCILGGNISFLHCCCYIIQRPFSLGSCFVIITAAERRRSGISLDEFHFLFWPKLSAKKCSLGNNWISAKWMFEMQSCISKTRWASLFVCFCECSIAMNIHFYQNKRPVGWQSEHCVALTETNQVSYFV